MVACCPQNFSPAVTEKTNLGAMQPDSFSSVNCLQSALRKLRKVFFGEKCMLFSRGNSKIMGSWSEPRDLIGVRRKKILGSGMLGRCQVRRNVHQRIKN